MFVRYSDGVETIRQGEAETSEQIAATVLDIVKKVGARQRHTVRAVHAKSHGLLKVEGAIPHFPASKCLGIRFRRERSVVIFSSTSIFNNGTTSMLGFRKLRAFQGITAKGCLQASQCATASMTTCSG